VAVRRVRAVALYAGLGLLALSLALPFYGWEGLRTVGPTVGLLSGLALLAIPSRRRPPAALAAAGGAAAVALIAWRLLTPSTGPSPLVTDLLRADRSPTALVAGLVGATLVSVAGVLGAVGIGPRPRPRLRLRVAPGQAAAMRAAWRALWASRILVWAAGVFGVLVLGLDQTASGVSIMRPFGSVGNTLIAPGSAWDSRSYLSIAQFGYDAHYFTAFFPLYPVIVRLGDWSPQAGVITGIAISLAALLAALYLLHRLLSLDFERGVADFAVALVAFFPMALFFSAVYTESLFLALSVGAFYAARRGWWRRACVAGALASATRLTGVVVVVPLIVLYLQARPARRPGRELAWLLLVPAGTLAYLAYMGIHGDWLAPLHASRTYWNRRLVPGLGAVDGIQAAVRSVHQLVVGAGQRILATQPGGGLANPVRLASANLTDFAFLGFGVVSVVGAVRRLPAAYGAYAVAGLAVIASTTVPYEPLASFPRYLAVLFPCQVWLAVRVRSRVGRRAALVVSGVLLAVFSAQFARGAWVA
jgi:hypothetical protein